MLAKGYTISTAMLGAAGVVVAVLVMLTLSPVGMGPFGVMLWFLLVFGALSALAASGARWIAGKLAKHAREHDTKTATRRGFMIGGGATVLLGMSSLKQLNLRDALLLAILLLLVEFYLVARS